MPYVCVSCPPPPGACLFLLKHAFSYLFFPLIFLWHSSSWLMAFLIDFSFCLWHVFTRIFSPFNLAFIEWWTIILLTIRVSFLRILQSLCTLFFGLGYSALHGFQEWEKGLISNFLGSASSILFCLSVSMFDHQHMCAHVWIYYIRHVCDTHYFLLWN